MSYITSIGTANPRHRISQKILANFMVKAMGLQSEDARKLHAVFRTSGIETRHSVIGDYGRSNGFEFFPGNEFLEPFPSTRQRSDLFKEQALALSLTAINQCLEKVPPLDKSDINHLIVVSCTGIYAPGLDIDIVKALNLRSSINRTCINFMGCYASFNALKLANTICSNDKNEKVLIVCTELCSIHFQKENTEDNILANALFADGSAALLMEAQPREGLNLKPTNFHCDLIAESEQDMAWTVGNLGFEMKLSVYVPRAIRTGIRKLTQSLLGQIARDLSDVAYFAIHPGGKRILEAIEQELNIGKDSNRHAYEVSKKYGNMSSPTVLFVLNEICKNLSNHDHGKNILGLAFGPGLTLESMLLQIEIRPELISPIQIL
jgi:prepilin-type processing-associated H-X9-DG protein